MTRLDRQLALEFFLFSILGLVTVVVIYDLINLIEHLKFFLRYGANVIEVFLYYFYDLPATAGLLLPAGFSLGTFLVIGRLIRSNELIPLLAGGVSIFRIFAVFISIAVLVGGLSFVETELLATRARTKFLEYRKEAIQKRKSTTGLIRRDFLYISASGKVYEIKQLNLLDSTVTDWSIVEFDSAGAVKSNIQIGRARYTADGKWRAENVSVRVFDGEEESFNTYPRRALQEVEESVTQLAVRSMETAEMKLGELRRYISRMNSAGADISVELYDYYFRFASPLIVVIITVISLAASAMLPKGNVALGVGVGLMVSFLYWGSLQFTRPLGYDGHLPGWLAAWLPNILFSGVSCLLLIKVKR